LAFVPALVALLAACTAGPATTSTNGRTTVYNTYEADSGADSPGAASDDGEQSEAGVVDAGAAAYQGSPLCLWMATSCNPDDPATCVLPTEGGTPTCHVVPATSETANNGVGASTTCSAAGQGGDGASCTAQADCAPEYDCVGSGTCRRYCCAGNSVCNPTQFCDVQPLASATTTKVPVCMPIQPAGGCQLLDADSGDGSCPEHETCAVVRETGATGCVEIGGQQADQDCDVDHCESGLVCLGSPGERSCYNLCDTSSGVGCIAPQTCQGGLPLFQDPAVGVCR
jgi:hypothetical protein